MKYVLALAVFAVVALPVVAMAGDAEQANAVAAGAVQLSDQELDNVSAAGKADAPGQLMKAQLSQLGIPCTGPGKSCNAAGRLQSLYAQTNHGASSFAPGRNK
jgi:hypothetical protein